VVSVLAGASVAQEQGGITIVRDGYGVPHVYAPSRPEVSYGAGYALAQDRLWQMHVLRKAAKGEVSDLFGPPVVDKLRLYEDWRYKPMPLTRAEAERLAESRETLSYSP
jgi:acyl-homoserine lactone acylase PvdQ